MTFVSSNIYNKNVSSNKGGVKLADTLKKSRAEYFKQRRKKQYIFYASIDKEKGEKLEKELKEKKQTKTEWLNEKIAQIDE